MASKRSEEFYKSLISLPPSPHDLDTYSNMILEEFVKELESKKTTVKWNYGLDEVVFLKKIKELKESYGIRDDSCDSDEPHGTGTSGHNEKDSGLDDPDQSSRVWKS